MNSWPTISKKLVAVAKASKSKCVTSVLSKLQSDKQLIGEYYSKTLLTCDRTSKIFTISHFWHTGKGEIVALEIVGLLIGPHTCSNNWRAKAQEVQDSFILHRQVIFKILSITSATLLICCYQ